MEAKEESISEDPSSPNPNVTSHATDLITSYGGVLDRIQSASTWPSRPRKLLSRVQKAVAALKPPCSSSSSSWLLQRIWEHPVTLHHSSTGEVGRYLFYGGAPVTPGRGHCNTFSGQPRLLPR
ncbi:hypothetical protein Y1Q_0014337 [Alligator mississippiensis]|uniref:Uncharacterized protein n=1 Tax=Alligator mississippiensis TaxID=8496 RepID=A0A151N2E9_ALLMI|nr:hypothetical protein Y1Q_0014337 [Alligator mississippiensis]